LIASKGDDGGSQEEENIESFDDLYAASVISVQVGEIVKGDVVSIDRDMVTVDIGFKSEGLIHVSEFTDSSGQVNIKPGEEVEVYIDSLGERGGPIKLSYARAKQWRVWKVIEDAFNAGTTIHGKVTGRVKGGLMVDVGVSAFLPGSHVDVRPSRSLDKYIGEEAEFSVLKFNRSRGNVVVSRRSLIEKEREAQRSETLQILEEGVVIEGTVKNVTDYGAFVDLGGIDGLLHVTDMSWGRVGHPSEVVKPGEVVKVVVLKLDSEKDKVSLGLKQLQEDPWLTVAERLFPGSRVRGKVVSLADYGAFVEVEPGVEGLVHVSEMSWTSRVQHPSKIVSVGDDVEVVVLALDPANRRISLGLKQALPNPWERLPIDHPVGTSLKGKVTSLTDFGAFVSVAEGIDGLIHISDMHWTKKVHHPSEILSKGDEVECVVLATDIAHERLSLGLKQLSEDPWADMDHRYPPATRVKGKITNVTDFGVFVELEEGVEGMVHVSQLAKERIDDPRDRFHVGEEIEAQVTQIDRRERRISLSVRALETSAEKEEMQRYMAKPDEGSRFSLGDMINEELDRDRSTKEANDDNGGQA